MFCIQSISYSIINWTRNHGQNCMDSKKSLKMYTIQWLRIRIFFSFWKYTLWIFGFRGFCYSAWTIHSWHSTSTFRFDWRITFLLWIFLVYFWIFHGRFHWFRSMGFFTSCASTKNSTFILLIIIIVIIFLPIFYINKKIWSQYQIRSDILYFFVTNSELPFWVLDEDLDYLDWVLFFQDLYSFIICCMLFFGIVCNPGQFDP